MICIHKIVPRQPVFLWVSENQEGEILLPVRFLVFFIKKSIYVFQPLVYMLLTILLTS
jgi:hypothetical protein